LAKVLVPCSRDSVVGSPTFAFFASLGTCRCQGTSMLIWLVPQSCCFPTPKYYYFGGLDFFSQFPYIYIQGVAVISWLQSYSP